MKKSVFVTFHFPYASKITKESPHTSPSVTGSATYEKFALQQTNRSHEIGGFVGFSVELKKCILRLWHCCLAKPVSSKYTSDHIKMVFIYKSLSSAILISTRKYCSPLSDLV